MESNLQQVQFNVEFDMSGKKAEVSDINFKASEGPTYKQKVLAYLKEQVESCQTEMQHYDTMIPELLQSPEFKMEAIKARERLRMARNIHKVLELL